MILSSFLPFNTLTELISDRLFTALSTLPNLTDCFYATFLLFIYGLITISLGFWFNFLQLDLKFSQEKFIKITVTSLVSPAILEELFFRAILLPCSAEKMQFSNLFTWSIISLLLFVAYHPLNGITFFPAGRDVFFNPIFLCLAALLGLVCTVVYLQSGSIWLPVVIHWLTVVIWLLYVGGINKFKIS